MITRHPHQPAGAGAVAAMFLFAALSVLLPLLFWISTSG
jgi:hypothetical protein